MNKPPIVVKSEEDRGNNYLIDRLEAQRDADVAYYESIIQQAREEVAREIIEDIGFIAQSEKLTQYLKDKYLKG